MIGQTAVQVGHSSVEPGEQCSIKGGSADRARQSIRKRSTWARCSSGETRADGETECKGEPGIWDCKGRPSSPARSASFGYWRRSCRSKHYETAEKECGDKRELNV